MPILYMVLFRKRLHDTGHLPVEGADISLIIYYSMPRGKIFFIVPLIFYPRRDVFARNTVARGDRAYPFLCGAD